MSIAYISLGGNVGDSIEYQVIAVEKLKDRVGAVLAKSSYYETSPWGVERSRHFVNSVVKLKTDLSPDHLMESLLAIEQSLQRSRTDVQYEPRTIDLDILYYDDLVIDSPKLTIPHPRVEERRFVLVPLNEIAKDHVDPVSGKKVGQLLEELKDPGVVTILQCATTTLQ